MAEQPGAEPRSVEEQPKPEPTDTAKMSDVVNEPLTSASEAANIAVGVGDLTSTAKGSGARFNIGKVPMETIPVWIIAEGAPVDYRVEALEARGALAELGRWQLGEIKMRTLLREAPLDAWEEAAQVFHHVTTRPVKPYPMWNWAKGMLWSVPTACAVRHLLAILRGEENDPETGLPHRGHAMCNLIMLAQYERTYPEGDDRPEFLRQSAVA